MEERYQCDVTQQVKYVTGQQTRQNVLELRIPLEDYSAPLVPVSEAKEQEQEQEEEVLKRQKLNVEKAPSTTIPFEACLDTYFQGGQVDIRNPSLGSELSTATKTATFSSFPKYLMVKLGR
jgi:uncharacterized UBP type Zn finger protein